MIVRSRAPLRLAFAGGGTDIHPFIDEYKGMVFNATINKYVNVSIEDSKEKGIKITSLDYNLNTKLKNEPISITNNKLGLIEATLIEISEMYGLDIFNSDINLDVVIDSDVPPGSGLGSSSAVCVAVTGAMMEYFGIRATKYEIAQIAYDIERVKLKINGGAQDQYAATFGGFNLIEFEGNDVIVNSIKLAPSVINELEMNLIVIFTGESHISDHIIEKQLELYEKNKDEMVKIYKQDVEYAILMKNELCKENVSSFPGLLEKAFENKKKFFEKISNKMIEDIYALMKSHGALGGRILGAGGGGYMLFFIDMHRKKELISVLQERNMRFFPITFDTHGMQSWKVPRPPRS
ncbi:MAG: GHMP family kinase ATP-binding protein [Promethearchaeota archaeon]